MTRRASSAGTPPRVLPARIAVPATGRNEGSPLPQYTRSAAGRRCRSSSSRPGSRGCAGRDPPFRGQHWDRRLTRRAGSGSPSSVRAGCYRRSGSRWRVCAPLSRDVSVVEGSLGPSVCRRVARGHSARSRTRCLNESSNDPGRARGPGRERFGDRRDVPLLMKKGRLSLPLFLFRCRAAAAVQHRVSRLVSRLSPSPSSPPRAS